MPRSCPLGHTCENCLWEVTVQGKNPQTGADMDKTSCVLPMLSLLMMDNTKEQRGTAAAVESFRNEMVKSNAQLLLSQYRFPKDQIRNDEPPLKADWQYDHG